MAGEHHDLRRVRVIEQDIAHELFEPALGHARAEYIEKPADLKTRRGVAAAHPAVQNSEAEAQTLRAPAEIMLPELELEVRHRRLQTLAVKALRCIFIELGANQLHERPDGLVLHIPAFQTYKRLGASVPEHHAHLLGVTRLEYGSRQWRLIVSAQYGTQQLDRGHALDVRDFSGNSS